MCVPSEILSKRIKSIMASSAFYRGSSSEAKCQSHGNHHMEITAEFRHKICNRSSLESVELFSYLKILSSFSLAPIFVEHKISLAILYTQVVFKSH